MRRPLVAIIIVLLTASVSAPGASLADGKVEKPDQSGHTVVKGDTLWDLSGRYLDDPFLWPEIWEANPDIKDPNLIYPGEEVKIPEGVSAAGAARNGRAVATPLPGKGPAEKSKEGADGPDTRFGQTFEVEEPFVEMGETFIRMPEARERKVLSLDTGEAPKRPVATLYETIEAGFLGRGLFEDELDFAGSKVPGRSYFSLGDVLYLHRYDIELKKGDYVLAYRSEGLVMHPVEFLEYMGGMVQPSGLLQVIDITPDFYVVKIVMTVVEITSDDMYTPYTLPELVYEPVPKNPGMRGKWGYIVASRLNVLYSAETYVIYIDIGAEDGVKIGDMLEIRRPGETVWAQYGYHTRPVKMIYPFPVELTLSDFKRVLPEVAVGTAQVLSVQDETATALITQASEELVPGYRVYYKD